MKIYKATVRLSGSNDNEVPKIGLTAAEIIILRRLHGGDDAVIRVVETSKDQRSHAAERERLKRLYGDEIVGKIFPGDYSDLPTELPKSAPVVEQALDEEVQKLLG